MISTFDIEIRTEYFVHQYQKRKIHAVSARNRKESEKGTLKPAPLLEEIIWMNLHAKKLSTTCSKT